MAEGKVVTGMQSGQTKDEFMKTLIKEVTGGNEEQNEDEPENKMGQGDTGRYEVQDKAVFGTTVFFREAG